MQDTYLLNQEYLKTSKTDYYYPSLISSKRIPDHTKNTYTKTFICKRGPYLTMELIFTNNIYHPLPESPGFRRCQPPNNWELTVIHRDRDKKEPTLELDMILSMGEEVVDFAQIEYGFVAMLNSLRSLNMGKS